MGICEDSVTSLLSSYILLERKSRKYITAETLRYLRPPLSVMDYMAGEFEA